MISNCHVTTNILIVCTVDILVNAKFEKQCNDLFKLF